MILVQIKNSLKFYAFVLRFAPHLNSNPWYIRHLTTVKYMLFYKYFMKCHGFIMCRNSSVQELGKTFITRKQRLTVTKTSNRSMPITSNPIKTTSLLFHPQEQMPKQIFKNLGKHEAIMSLSMSLQLSRTWSRAQGTVIKVSVHVSLSPE